MLYNKDIKKLINHKGQWCIYKDVFCQEGYCTECEIYKKYIEELKVRGYINVLDESHGCIRLVFS